MIEFDQVSKSFANKKALFDLRFKIKNGEIIGLLGVNGAGKTTMMRLLSGFFYCTSGMVKIDGLAINPEEKRSLKKIGYLPENNPLWSEMTVKDYLSFVYEIKEVKSIRMFDRVVSDCSLESVINDRIENLSHGFKQRVGLAAAIINEPEILILDEPTSGLDPIEQKKILTLIKKQNKKGTVILSTHQMSEAESICTRAIILNKGNIIYDGPVPKKTGELERLFLKKLSQTYK